MYDVIAVHGPGLDPGLGKENVQLEMTSLGQSMKFEYEPRTR